MPEYVYGGGALPATKSDLIAVPGGADVTKYLPASDVNTVMSAITDLKAALLAGKYHGVTIQSVTPPTPPPGQITLFIRSSDGTLCMLANDGSVTPVISLTPISSVVTASGATASRGLSAWFADSYSVKAFGAVGDGTTDDTAAIQAALNTGKSIFFPSATYKITNSLYAQNSGQTLFGDATITMDASLGKPCLWLGATDAAGTPVSASILNVKVRGLRFIGTGSKVSGSSGIAFVKSTTTILDSVLAWSFYAGIDIRGVSLINQVQNADLRSNNYGVWDRTDGTGTINFQGSRFVGGRIEANVQEGVVLGSADVGFIGTAFESNATVANGGNGTDAEVRITAGFVSGSVDFVDCYMEIAAANTGTAMIQVDASCSRRLTISGGQYYAADATNRYIIKTLSASTVQAFAILGGQFTLFKNWITGAISNNSTAVIHPAWADNSRDATVDLTASAGATIWQLDRTLGAKSVGQVVNALSLTTNAAAAATAIQLITNSFINFGGTATLKGDGSQLIANGNMFLGGGGTGVLHAGQILSDSTSAPFSVRGSLTDGASAVAVKVGNLNALSNATAKITSFYSDNLSTERAYIDVVGGIKGQRFIAPISADRGDTAQTLTAGTDAQIQRWATTLTANRVVTLSTTNAVNGDHFRVVRTGLGAFTLDVGGLKTIPSATAAFVDVAYSGSAWVLTGYGTL